MEPLTRESLGRLPLRALVALAAKCARRAQPTFVAWNDGCGSEQHANAVEAAIACAESLARGEKEPHELNWDGSRIEAAAFAAGEVAAKQNNAFHVQNAAESAGYAAMACQWATDVIQSMGGVAPGRIAEVVVRATWDAIQRMIWSHETNAEQSAARQAAVEEFNALLARNLGIFPALGTAVRL